MNTWQTTLATVSASDELPEVWGLMAFAAFALGSLLACAAFVYACFARRRAAWFRPVSMLAILLGAGALAFAVHVYQIDYIAVERDGTKASPPLWQSLAIPSLPILVSLAALILYQRRSSLR